MRQRETIEFLRDDYCTCMQSIANRPTSSKRCACVDVINEKNNVRLSSIKRTRTHGESSDTHVDEKGERLDDDDDDVRMFLTVKLF